MGLEEPVVGFRICDGEHCPPLQERRPPRLPVGPLAQITTRRTLSWSSWAADPPVSPEEHGIEGPVPQPPGGR